jgi:predicted metal-dependent peptidase
MQVFTKGAVVGPQEDEDEGNLVVRLANAGQTLQRVKKARTWLNTYLPFLGYMTLKLRPRLAVERDRVPTAAVAPDGTLVLSDDYVSRLSDPEVRGLLCHEVLHPALLFWDRCGLRSVLGFNIAHDFAINLLIEEYALSMGKADSIALPPGGLLDRKWENQSAEQIYDALQKEGGGGGGGGHGPVGPGRPGDEPGDEPGGPGDEPGLEGDCREDLSQTQIGKKAAKGDEGAQRQLKQEWYVEVKAAEIAHQDATRGDLPGAFKKLVEGLYEPTITWSEYVSRYVGENLGGEELTYSRPSRRSESVGEVLPGRDRRTNADLTILWDTSGSMNGWEKRILSEIDGLCEELGLAVRVLICDAMVHADLEDCESAIDIIEGIAGGGGSDFRPALTLLEEENDNSLLIGFTDGQICVSDVPPPQLKGVLWVVTEHGDFLPWGTNIRINTEGEVIG